jgi:hypothetical protein
MAVSVKVTAFWDVIRYIGNSVSEWTVASVLR